MVFSSTVFLFFYLPVTVVVYLVCPSKWKNTWLLFMSLLFYYWGGASFFIIMLYSIAINYLGGRIIDILRKRKKNTWCKTAFVITLVLNIGNLVYWKYAVFLMQIVQEITGWRVQIPEILLPIGISFFTFQGMSYVIDLYRKEVPVQRNLLKLALYIALFPQLIAGPIVRYSDIEKQLTNHRGSVDMFASGIRYFTIGLAKKAILANSVALVSDKVFALSADQRPVSVAWLGVICYTFQLYFDFSGYSDMAIGLGKMFGFEFPQNFNYPYISCSITDFWHRWHISLSTWFRDYVYIPLGGSRKGNVYVHLFIVFLLTGIWHGASWNFVLWGIYFGILIIIERWMFTKWKKRLIGIKWLGWLRTMFLWIVSMVPFRADTIEDSISYYRCLFGIQQLNQVGFTLEYYVHRYEVFILIICSLTMLPIGKWLYRKLQRELPDGIFTMISNAGTLCLLGVSILYVVTSTYNPFIYFQF